ncbi:MAG TPA: peroxiredoxin [Acetobacteraceae bacterium]|jgi:organic hydroperoxide reductase OsmC/OhrA|nr:peroxiredoxin [Acetobacteraceae bacterium]
MTGKKHRYRVAVEWTGNQGSGTSTYAGYGREHVIRAGTKAAIAGSADPAFRGDAARWNPEELLLASIAACHKLWYLHLCSAAGIVVMRYTDEAEAIMEEDPTGAGRFVSAELHPHVVIQASGDTAKAARLHHDAHQYCFIANSVNFPIGCVPVITTGTDT